MFVLYRNYLYILHTDRQKIMIKKHVWLSFGCHKKLFAVYQKVDPILYKIRRVCARVMTYVNKDEPEKSGKTRSIIRRQFPLK